MDNMYDILKSFDSLSTEEASTGNKRKATTGSMKALLESFDSIANETEEVAEEELQEGAMKRQLIHDMETMTKSEFAKKPILLIGVVPLENIIGIEFLLEKLIYERIVEIFTSESIGIINVPIDSSSSFVSISFKEFF